MNFYDILHCHEKSSKEQILCEYKNIVRSCHPDKGGCKKVFQDVTAAKDVLTNSEMREKYDF